MASTSTPKPQQPPAGLPDGPDGSAVAGEFPPVPDEDGPHDVPDETVIEKTLPAAGSVGKDGPAS